MRQRLGVNVDHVATLRQVRRAAYPDPVTAAALAEAAGAGQITIHLREDRRHIQDRDLKLLRETCQTLLNLEMAATQEMVKIAYEVKPDLVIQVSLFIDPDLDQVRAAHKLSADRIELHTGRYCEARKAKERARELIRVVDAARAGAKLGLGVAAGHGLNYQNVEAIARIPEIDELNIGHAIVARAVLVGMDRAVRDMLQLMQDA